MRRCILNGVRAARIPVISMSLQLINRLLQRYYSHDEAIIISCFYNPTHSTYRRKAFDTFYATIKHLDHCIVECVCNETDEFELPVSPHIKRIRTASVLWHKEALLNNVIAGLPSKYKYIFWVDADVLFTNKAWIVDGVEALKVHKIIQPFEYCIHLEQGETKPSFNVEDEIPYASIVNGPGKKRHPNLWKSFASNVDKNRQQSNHYDEHGHVGFAWGIRRDVLNRIQLYDHALVGGADHIMAHAAMGHIGCECIKKSFTEDVKAINAWSKKFFAHIGGNMGYVRGNLYHIWHGDLQKRQYLKRVKEFTGHAKQIRKKDKHGLYVASPVQTRYVEEYLHYRDNDDTLLNNLLYMNHSMHHDRPHQDDNRPIDGQPMEFNTPPEFIPDEIKSHDDTTPNDNFS